jgi:transcription elongation factor Elf1
VIGEGQRRLASDLQVEREIQESKATIKCPQCGRENSFFAKVCPRCEHHFAVRELPSANNINCPQCGRENSVSTRICPGCEHRFP